jgi:hypothetical protein
MPKNKISEYSTTNSNNTDIESINIDEGCAPSGINNAIRELMVHLKEFQTGASGDPLTVAGTFVASGGATIAASAGTSASPSIHFSSDTNTGIFSPAADTIAFAEGGVEVMRINSSGNVGIGTTSPAVSGLEISRATGSATPTPAELRIATTTSASDWSTTSPWGRLSFYSADASSAGPKIQATIDAIATGAGGGTSHIVFQSAADSTGTLTERMRINSSGNVGIGTSSPRNVAGYTNLALDNATNGGLLDINYNGDRKLSFLSSSTTGIINTNTSTDLVFQLAGGECMRITSDGEVLVGGTTAVATTEGFVTVQRTNSQPGLLLYRNDTSISDTDILGLIQFYGNDTTSNTPTALAYIRAAASGTHAAGDNPTDLVFGCTNDGSETVAEFARLAQDGAATRIFSVRQATLTNTQYASVEGRGGTAGSINRIGGVGVFKHSGITNSCAYLQLDPEDGTDNFLWVDNSDVLRISTTSSNIGTTGGTVVGTQTSDERLKDISGPVTYGLNEVLSIEPIAFTMKDDPNIPKIGFSAQQVQPIVPEAVYDTKECIDGYTENEETKEQIPNSDRTKLAMEYTQLIPVLVNAVKELSAKCDALQAEVNALKGQ